MKRIMRLVWTNIGLCSVGLTAAVAGTVVAHQMLGESKTVQAATTGCGLRVRGGETVSVNVPNRGMEYHHTFILDNDGSDTITIHSVQASCSCSTANMTNVAVPPGGHVSLPVSIDKFPSEMKKSVTNFIVRTDRGETPLRIEAHLPLPTSVMVRPAVVHLDPLPGDSIVRRTVVVRIPKQCVTPVRLESLRKTGCEGLGITLVEVHDSELFQQYRLDIHCTATQAQTMAGAIEFDTGCELVTIRIVPSTK